MEGAEKTRGERTPQFMSTHPSVCNQADHFRYEANDIQNHNRVGKMLSWQVLKLAFANIS